MFQFLKKGKMLPKYHVFYGGVFAFLAWLIFPRIGIYALFIFLASFLIDIDHYFIYVTREKDFNFKKSFTYFTKIHEKIKLNLKKRKKVKAPLVVLHTIEFLILLTILSLFNMVVFFMLVGFFFHSVLDVIQIHFEFKTLSIRHFSLIFYFVDKNNSQIVQL